MKPVILIFLLTLLSTTVTFGQVKIGDNPQNIDPSSVLELESSTQVLVITRVSTLEMEAITPQRGGVVYNTDTECMHYYNGANWINLCDATSFSLTNEPIDNINSTISIVDNGSTINLEVALNSIRSENIVDGGINGDDIQDNSIGESKLGADSVGASELRDNSVNTLQIIDGSITPGDIANTIPNQVLTTDINGVVLWDDKANLRGAVADELSITGSGTVADPLMLTDAITTNILANTTAITAHISADNDTDDQNEVLSNAELDGNELVLTESGIETRVDLTSLNNAGTDNQTLDLTGNTLAITGGNTIDLANYLDNTDEQQLTIAGDRISLTDGGFVDLPAGTVDTDEQQLTIAGTRISLTDGGFVDLPAGTVDTDEQNLTLAGTTLNISNGIGVDLNPILVAAADGDETILNEGTNITITGDGTTAAPYIINAAGGAAADGSETEITEGANITITGNGTAATPYVINAEDAVGDGSETEINQGTNITITGEGTTGNPYVINSVGGATADGSETEIINSPTVTVAGTGTNGNPYILTSLGGADGSETIVNEGTNITITGVGTLANPYLINASSTVGIDWSDLVSVPVGFLDDIDNDTQYIAGPGLILTGNEFSLNAGTLVADWGNLTGIPADLDLDQTDDFDGEFGSLANIPADLADGDADTQYTAGAGLVLSTGNEFSLNTGTLVADWGNLTGIPADLDLDQTDDFDGEFGSLANIPADLADGDADTQYTAGAGLVLSAGNEFSLNTGTLVADWGNLTGIPADLDLDQTDDFDGEFGSLANIPADLADGDADTQYTAGTGLVLSTGNEFSLNTGTLVADWGNLTGIPADLDLDQTDDFDGEFGSLANIPADLADGDADTQYTAGAGLVLSAGNEFSITLGGTSNLSNTNLGQTINTNRTYDLNSGNLIFTGTGNIGIGNFNSLGLPNGPADKLDVNGQIRTRAGFAANPGTVGLPSYGFYTNDDNDTGMYRAGNNQIGFSTGGVQALLIDENQDIFIPNGSVTVGATLVHPDYVFQKYFTGNSILNSSYQFQNLKDIEAFVKQNNHLPGLKSAKEIKQQGFWDLGEASRINLEKIEELFLHTIEQEKKIKTLSSEKEELATKLEALQNEVKEIKRMLLTKKGKE